MAAPDVYVKRVRATDYLRPPARTSRLGRLALWIRVLAEIDSQLAVVRVQQAHERGALNDWQAHNWYERIRAWEAAGARTPKPPQHPYYQTTSSS
jgi:hypothetical protein